MSLSLASMQPAPVGMPPVRPTSYRYWEDYRADELRAVLDKIALVIDDKQRQFDLIAVSKLDAASTLTVSAPAAAPTTKNETLGEILSPSQANTFLNCSAKWWFKYGAGLPDPKGGSLVRGLAVHKTIERWFRLILEGAAPDIEDMREPYDDAWEALSADASFAADDDIDELKRSGAVLLRKYLEEVAPEIRPAALEQQVIGEIGGVKVRGYIDIVDVDGNIIDLKTTAQSPRASIPVKLPPKASGKAWLDTLVATKTQQHVEFGGPLTDRDNTGTNMILDRFT